MLSWLRTSGNRIIAEESGEPVLLRGVNRSGLEYSEPDEFGYLPAAGITRREIEYIAREWGANIVRLPFSQERVLNDAENYLLAIDTVITWCARNSMYTLLDLQWLDRETRIAPLPDAGGVLLWQTLAARYRSESSVLYDIYNEPHDCTFSQWKPRALELIDAIRAVHERALIFVSGTDWGYDLRGMPLDRHNLVYSSHVYRNKQTSWDLAFGELARTQPVFAGEWGCFEGEEAWGERLMEYFNEREMGWTAWSWSDKPHLVHVFIPQKWGEIARRNIHLTRPARFR